MSARDTEGTGLWTCNTQVLHEIASSSIHLRLSGVHSFINATKTQNITLIRLISVNFGF